MHILRGAHIIIINYTDEIRYPKCSFANEISSTTIIERSDSHDLIITAFISLQNILGTKKDPFYYPLKLAEINKWQAFLHKRQKRLSYWPIVVFFMQKTESVKHLFYFPLVYPIHISSYLVHINEQ